MGRLFYYLSDLTLLRARIGGYHIGFVEELLTLRRRFGISFASLVDVGAHEGKFMDAFRFVAGAGPIVAFEPVPARYEALESRFAGDNCTIYPFALSLSEARRTMFVAGQDPFNSLFSSLAEPEARLEDISGGGVDSIKTIEVETRRLDSVVDLGALPSPVLLKLNTNETELDILRGASENLRHVACVRVVYSFTKYYRGNWEIMDLISFMREHGFTSFFQGVITPTAGAVLWCDLFFLNDNLGAS
jgi:FkbM family methyltransferase